jgi:hypothetical protein
MTEQNYRSRQLLEEVQLLGNFPHGDQCSATNPADAVFLGFPDIDQRQLLARI